MPNHQDMAGLFKGLLEERILVFDGAMGTAIKESLGEDSKPGHGFDSHRLMKRR